MTTHLWEIKHSYYCNESNWFQNGCNHKFDSFADFFEDCGNIDLDYNLLFRWDWLKADEEDEESERGDILNLFLMQQRKGIYFSYTIKVTEADEPAVRAFLQRAFNHLAALWLPIQFDAASLKAELVPAQTEQ